MTSILDLTNAAGRVAGSLSHNAHGSSALPASAASASAAGATGKTAAVPTGGTITSKDFLTLLVTEMKNQDPTQPTDPNQYIQQLVGVNSLQQLIAINNDLGGSKTP